MADADCVYVEVELERALEEEHGGVETGLTGLVVGMGDDLGDLDDLELEGLLVVEFVAELPFAGLDGYGVGGLTARREGGGGRRGGRS